MNIVLFPVPVPPTTHTHTPLPLVQTRRRSEQQLAIDGNGRLAALRGRRPYAAIEASVIALRQQRHGPSKRLIDKIISASNFGFHPQATTFPKSIAQWKCVGQSICKRKGRNGFFCYNPEWFWVRVKIKGKERTKASSTTWHSLVGIVTISPLRSRYFCLPLLQLSNATIFPQTAEKENTERDFVGNYAALQKRLVSLLFTFGNSIDLRYRHQRLGMQITPPRKNKSEIKTQRGNSPAKKKIVGKAQKTGTWNLSSGGGDKRRTKKGEINSKGKTKEKKAMKICFSFRILSLFLLQNRSKKCSWR